MYSYNFSCRENDEARNKEMIRKVGTNIRRIRLRRSMTQEGLAEKAEINPKYLGELERGEKNGTILVISRISEALDVPICAILSSNHCFLKREKLLDEVKSLFHDKNDDQSWKAIKILTVFFE